MIPRKPKLMGTLIMIICNPPQNYFHILKTYKKIKKNKGYGDDM